jgi:hypothetical protein
MIVIAMRFYCAEGKSVCNIWITGKIGTLRTWSLLTGLYEIRCNKSSSLLLTWSPQAGQGILAGEIIKQSAFF